jgi:hypothetical protein
VRGRQPVGAVQERGLTFARGQDERDRIRHQPPRGEQQRRRARAVEQVRVVDEECERSLLGARTQQAEGRGADREAVLGAGRSKRQGAGQRGRLRRGDAVQRVERRAQQLAQPGKRDLGFRLDPARP